MADVDDLGWRYSRHGYGPEDYAGRGVSHGAADAVTRWFGGDGTGQLRPQDHVRARDQRGRGPKGYRRRDERIREDIADWLTDDAWIDASDIEITVERGEVTLSGTVDSRETRRRAEDIAEAAAGVTHVQNNLSARPTRARRDAAATPSAATWRAARRPPGPRPPPAAGWATWPRAILPAARRADGRNPPARPAVPTP
jgi:hypothetical protein